jgi:hypothetical protein
MENDRRTPAYLVVCHRSKMVDDAWFAANFWLTIVIIAWEVKRKKLWSLVKFENHRGGANTTPFGFGCTFLYAYDYVS